MIIDHRTYTVQHGQMADYLKIFEAEAMPVQLRHLDTFIGYFQSAIGPLNQVIHLWGYQDLADMERRRNARDADPDWKAYLQKSAGMLVAQENKIIKPVSFSPLK